jgi:hypothetical protein
MIWFGIFIVVLGIALFLAYRSMRDYQEIPKVSKLPYGLFLISQSNLLQKETLQQLYQITKKYQAIISLERLTKGNQTAFAIYGPKNLVQAMGQLKLVELEDYLGSSGPKQVQPDQTYSCVYTSRKEKEEIVENGFLDSIILEEDQQLFWQIVCLPDERESTFQVTVRLMMVDADPTRRIQTAKKIDEAISNKTFLAKQDRDATSGQLYESYKARTLVPHTTSKFTVSAQKVFELLDTKE